MKHAQTPLTHPGRYDNKSEPAGALSTHIRADMVDVLDIGCSYGFETIVTVNYFRIFVHSY